MQVRDKHRDRVFALKALAEAEAEAEASAEAFGRNFIQELNRSCDHVAAIHLARQQQVRAAQEVDYLRGGGTARRPSRRMPSTKAIASWHGHPDKTCWRCGRHGRVERAHIVDRVFGGLDGVQNLALLCEPCHAQMPIVRPIDQETGRSYVGLSAHDWTRTSNN